MPNKKSIDNIFVLSLYYIELSLQETFAGQGWGIVGRLVPVAI